MPKAKKSDTVTLVVVSDLHCGSTLGLMPPEVELDDGGVYRQSPGQQWIWNYWDESWDHVFRTAKGTKLITVVNGDIIDGNHHNTTQIWSSRVLDHKKAAVESLLVPANRSDQMYIVRGTAAHVGETGSVEDDVARELGAVGKRSYHHLHLDIQGLNFEFLHHGPSPGKRSYLRGNELRYAVRSDMISELAERQTPPDVLVYSHYHTFIHEPVTLGQYRTDGFLTPAWMGKSEYAFKAVGRKRSDIGMIIFTIRDGVYTWQPRYERLSQKESFTI